MTSELQHAELSYRAAAQRAEQLREARNAAIFAALDAGVSHTVIADATGLTRGRVGQLAQTQRAARESSS
jgi:hypothetical protein